MINKQAALEMLKTAGRLAFFAALAAIIAYFGHVLAGLDQTNLFVMAGTLLLSMVDKYVHENDNIKLSGVAPF